jgi:hypothetical protein
MATNFDRFKADLDSLLKLGFNLQMAMAFETNTEQFKAAAKKAHGKEADEFIKTIPSFKSEYQKWYSESLALLRQLLPDRIADFVRHYEKPKGRKAIDFENYRIEDYLQGLRVTRGYEKIVVVDASAAIPHFDQQVAIIEAAKARFSSSIFEIRQLVQADLLDSELESAEVLAKHKFTRAAGAVAGVVLERHLRQVCTDRSFTTGKKNPTISDLNEALKAGGAVDLPQWRFIQHLADIRNLCDHSKVPEPTAEQVNDLIAGTKKITKTVY